MRVSTYSDISASLLGRQRIVMDIINNSASLKGKLAN